MAEGIKVAALDVACCVILHKTCAQLHGWRGLNQFMKRLRMFAEVDFGTRFKRMYMRFNHGFSEG